MMHIFLRLAGKNLRCLHLLKGKKVALMMMLVFSASANAQTQAIDPGMNLIIGGSTPAAIRGNPSSWLPANSCPVIAPDNAKALQPIRINAANVESKNKLGCLSPADAMYRSDGCPKKLCGAKMGVVPLTMEPNLH